VPLLIKANYRKCFFFGSLFFLKKKDAMPLADTASMLVERNEIETELEAAKRRVSELEKMLASNQIVETAPVAGLETGHAGNFIAVTEVA
jgi:ABC-type antimicrobial peptide transport system ATPase subunit